MNILLSNLITFSFNEHFQKLQHYSNLEMHCSNINYKYRILGNGVIAFLITSVKPPMLE